MRAVAIGVLYTIGVDSQGGENALTCLEDIPGNAGEAISIGFVIIGTEDIDQCTGTVFDIISIDAVNAEVSSNLVAESNGDGCCHDAGISTESVAVIASETIAVGHVALLAVGVQSGANSSRC